MTIGDVLAVVAFLGGGGASWWALLIVAALATRERSAPARLEAISNPRRVLGRGLLVAALAGVLILVLANAPNGALKLLGWIVFLLALGLAAVGGGALSLLLSHRLQSSAPNLSPLAAVSRASGLLVGAQFVPLLGWLGLVPLTLIASLGLGWRTLRPPKLLRESAQELGLAQPNSSNSPNGAAAHPVAPAAPLSNAEGVQVLVARSASEPAPNSTAVQP